MQESARQVSRSRVKSLSCSDGLLRHDFPTEWSAFANGSGDLDIAPDTAILSGL
jgi:hypothetical protein